MSEETSRFLNAAQRYCDLVESIDDVSLHEFLTRMGRTLPELYLAAQRLPVEFVDGEDLPDRLSHEEARSVLERLRAKLGDADEYWAVYDPWEREDPIPFSLADDLSDIYRDLRDVLADRRGDAVGVWDWRIDFVHHWGRHAVSAMWALHGLLHDPEHVIHPEDAT